MHETGLKDLLSKCGVSELRYLPKTGSTNADAIKWLETGCPDFSVVIADEQTAGRGRFDRKWVTKPGVALAFSVVIKPRENEMPYIQLFSPLAGLAVYSGITSLYQLPVEIKWPNDILINRQKVCGILSETIWNNQALEGIVIGIGINISKGSISLGDMVSVPATSLEDHTADIVDRWSVLAQVLQQFKHWRNELATESFFACWEEHLAYKNEEVEIRGTAGAGLTGRLMGINSSGELILETDSGEVAVQVGDVHLRLRTS